MVWVPAIMIEEFCDFYSDLLGSCFMVCHDHCFLWYQSLLLCCFVCHKYRMFHFKTRPLSALSLCKQDGFKRKVL